MINPIKYIRHWFRLAMAQRTVRKYSIDDNYEKLKYRPLINRPVLSVIRIKVGNITCGLLITSQKRGEANITYVDYIWVNKKKFVGVKEDTESTYYETMYDVFLQWVDNFIISPKRRQRNDEARRTGSCHSYYIAISLNITNEMQIEQFRRILTLYGFQVNPELSLRDIEFKTPYRDKEVIKNVTYSRVV